jgi:hypothetical protein
MVRKVSSSSRLSAELVLRSGLVAKFIREHLRVHPGMLADVERVQVKAERANLAQQRVDVGSRQVLAAMRDRRLSRTSRRSCFELHDAAVGGSVSAASRFAAACETCRKESGGNFL